jgi:conjugative transfer region lipoprotein (TIGR03751 family)
MDGLMHKDELGMPMRAWTKLLAVSCGVMIVGGCASNKDALIPQNGPPMAEIYKKHMAGLEGGSARTARERLPLRPPEDVQPTAFTRTALNEINTRFGRVPNPDLVMFVFPHLAGSGQYPVPAYTTVFPMYDTVHYAMPGEIAPREMLTPSRAATGTDRIEEPSPGANSPRVKDLAPQRKAIPAVVPVRAESALRSDITP